MTIYDPTTELFSSKSSRKKKRFLLFLYSSKTADSNNVRSIERIISTSLQSFILIRLEDPDEALKAVIVKNIEGVIIDASFFMDDSIAIDFALEIKNRRKCPIFFIANNENKLVEEYRKKMFAYEELDDYFLAPIDPVEFSKSLKRATNNPGRAAKRFNLNTSLSIQNVIDEKKYSVVLNEISLIGFLITLEDDLSLQRKEQIRIKIPLKEFNIFHPIYGEFMHLSAKVQRISINGKKIGCSFEHITPMQQEVLIDIIENVSRLLNIQRINSQKKQMKDLD
ncbi:MAG: PilZ domain-containing protein [Silvanigrellaceae bacterium]|nr:PilZ domain-containing protein [Silvanigrellaceae bacterium]